MTESHTLTSPIELKGLELKNRVVMGPHRTNLAMGRSSTEKLLSYYMGHIRGGPAVLVTESASVTVDDWPYEYAPLAPAIISGWGELASYGKRHHCLVVASLSHSGLEGTSNFSQYAVVGPSLIPDVDSNELPKVASKTEILEIVEAFMSSARLAFEAGVQAVEINASHRSILRQFLSPLTNQRLDEYGKDPSLFLLQVLERIRLELPSLILGVRLSIDELTPWGGIVKEASLATATHVKPYVDYITATTGGLFTKSRYRSNFRYPYPTHVDLVRALKETVGTSALVVAQGSFFDVDEAESALSQSSCDLVEMTRALIADPALVHKVQLKGPTSFPIKPCVGCNQLCNPEDSRNIAVDCIVNPKHIDTTTLTYLEPRLYPKKLSRNAIHKVHIVGGGVAGIELATLLGPRYDEVHIYEKERSLGGLIALFERRVDNSRFHLLLTYYKERLSGIKSIRISLEHAVRSKDDLWSLEEDDLVVLATGAQSTPLVYVVPPPLYLSEHTVYTDTASYKGKAVAILDPRGNTESVITTEQIAKYAQEVYYICEDPAFGSRIAQTGDLLDSIRRLKHLGVNLLTFTEIRSIDPSGQIDLKRRFSNENRSIQVDLVHEIGGRVAPTLHPFAEISHVRIGDARVARTIYDAVTDARKLDLYLLDERDT